MLQGIFKHKKKKNQPTLWLREEQRLLAEPMQADTGVREMQGGDRML